jgi:predicted transcriptional regulator of viral defense system
MKKRPEDIFRKHGGQLRMSEAIEQGITRYMLYSLRNKGIIEQVSRGIYRLVELPPISNPDLVTVGLRFPNAIVCLISAPAYCDITTQIPPAVSVAVSRNSRPPSLDNPPIQAYRFSADAYKAGIEGHLIDGVSVKIYSP